MKAHVQDRAPDYWQPDTQLAFALLSLVSSTIVIKSSFSQQDASSILHRADESSTGVHMFDVEGGIMAIGLLLPMIGLSDVTPNTGPFQPLHETRADACKSARQDTYRLNSAERNRLFTLVTFIHEWCSSHHASWRAQAACGRLRTWCIPY